MQAMPPTLDSALDPALRHMIDQVQAAKAHGTALWLQGGGSKTFYGPRPTGAVLDTKALRGVVSYEPSELVVTARCGTPLAELEALLAEQGQYLPFEPPHFRWTTTSYGASSINHAGAQAASGATVGGMVACGLSGPARASVGAVRDYVLGLQMINGQGELLTFGGQVMKNVAGYDVSRLMVGAMGSLGLIAQVSLKVLPRAPAEASLLFELPQHAALEQLHRWGAQPLPLNASRWVPSGAGSGALSGQLFVRLRGAAAAVQAAQRSMLADQEGVVLDPIGAREQWEACRNQTSNFFKNPPGAASTPLSLWRISVAQTAPVLQLPWPTLVEWHGGLRWLWAPADAATALHAVAHTAGGNAIEFIADSASAIWPAARFGIQNATQQELQRRIKASFDPAGVFNPGCMAPLA